MPRTESVTLVIVFITLVVVLVGGGVGFVWANGIVTENVDKVEKKVTDEVNEKVQEIQNKVNSVNEQLTKTIGKTGLQVIQACNKIV